VTICFTGLDSIRREEPVPQDPKASPFFTVHAFIWATSKVQLLPALLDLRDVVAHPAYPEIQLRPYKLVGFLVGSSQAIHEPPAAGGRPSWDWVATPQALMRSAAPPAFRHRAPAVQPPAPGPVAKA